MSREIRAPFFRDKDYKVTLKFRRTLTKEWNLKP